MAGGTFSRDTKYCGTYNAPPKYGPGMHGMTSEERREEWGRALLLPSFIPGVGEAIDANNTRIAVNEGNYGEAIMTGVLLAGPGTVTTARRIPLVDWIFIEGSTLIDDVIRAGFRACSFSEDTLVTTLFGYQEISDIDVGMYVLAFDEETGELGYYPVTAVWSHEDPIIVHLTIDGELIETTPEHPFYTDQGDWVPAIQLQVGDLINSASNKYGSVDSIHILHRKQTMYNFTVQTAHTYYVGEDQWLVHNSCGEELAKLAHNALKMLPDQNRRATIGAAYDANGNVVYSVYGKNATESVEILRNQGLNVLDAPPIGVEYHAERQLFTNGFTDIGISRQAGMCSSCQSFFSNFPEVTITPFSR